MRANFFGDFEYYAEVNGQLFELTTDYKFDREVKLYKNSSCMIGKDFVHADTNPNINPCIKMDMTKGAHIIKLTAHHTRPFKGISYVSLKDDNNDFIFENELLPGDILKYEVKIKRTNDFNLYLAVSSSEVTHGMVRVLLQTEPVSYTGDVDIKLEKSHWKIKEVDLTPVQMIEAIVHDTEYKY
jgi:hypothetical protein